MWKGAEWAAFVQTDPGWACWDYCWLGINGNRWFVCSSETSQVHPSTPSPISLRFFFFPSSGKKTLQFWELFKYHHSCEPHYPWDKICSPELASDSLHDGALPTSPTLAPNPGPCNLPHQPQVLPVRLLSSLGSAPLPAWTSAGPSSQGSYLAIPPYPSCFRLNVICRGLARSPIMISWGP